MATGRPDWFGTIVSAGKYDTTFVPIAVDVDGNLVSLMKGAYDSALKTIALDEDGVMLANLSAQDLDFLTVRPAYGESVQEKGNKNITAGNTVSITTITGKGVVIGGWFRWGVAQSMKDLSIIIKTDGSEIEQLTGAVLRGGYDYVPGSQPLFLQLYDDDNFDYKVGMSSGLTFETSFEMAAKNDYGFDITVVYYIFYALVP